MRIQLAEEEVEFQSKGREIIGAGAYNAHTSKVVCGG